jgi:alcohol dehydrogenase
MKAVLYEQFRLRPFVTEVRDPAPSDGSVVVEVRACGICRSDWHGWMGNDPDITLPHVPGHELAGVVKAVGAGIRNWNPGDRVTVPFVGGCGRCAQCASGNQQVCDFQFQPGFTHWGAFAELVEIGYADGNLVGLPEEIDFVTAASLGCRFMTAFRAVVDQGRVAAGEWVAVHGCGGVGLSSIMIAKALGAKVVAVDVSREKLEFAEGIGADTLIMASGAKATGEAIKEATSGGANVSIDALGHPDAVLQSLHCLAKRGRHVQVGLLESERPEAPLPMNLLVAKEIEVVGSHGMQAHRYPEMLKMILDGKLNPERLVGGTVSLDESVEVLCGMDRFHTKGVAVIDRF